MPEYCEIKNVCMYFNSESATDSHHFYDCEFLPPPYISLSENCENIISKTCWFSIRGNDANLGKLLDYQIFQPPQAKYFLPKLKFVHFTLLKFLLWSKNVINNLTIASRATDEGHYQECNKAGTHTNCPPNLVRAYKMLRPSAQKTLENVGSFQYLIYERS